MKVLVIDDNWEMRRLIRSIIEDLAETIEECSDGSEALVAYERIQPDWVLMDIKMRRVDGIKATSAIMTSHPEARIVMVTDYDDADLKGAAWHAGAFRYVTKENLFAVRAILSAG